MAGADHGGTDALLRHLASRPGHDEVKADFRQLLIAEFGAELSQLDFERRVPEVRGRIDALIGRTVFEAKSDLSREWGDVTRRMPDYLADREREEGERYVGIASDGLKWAVFELEGDALVKLKDTTLNPEKPEEFLAFLDGALALKASLPTDAMTIKAELGQESIAYHRASTELAQLWERLKDNPAVALKRALWAQLLKLVYGKDVENGALFIQHTFLVVVAKAIASAVLDIREDDPKRLLSGEAFQSAGILGAVESDFFDWVVAVPEGEALVRRILAHVRRFRLREVQSDVLKILYENLIDRAERHGLGEYYTPDWLAAKVVKHSVDRPLEQKVLDAACGSGAFLFHAIRLVLAEASDGDVPPADRAGRATELVAGMDIHPVAVIIARVTYLLALAPVLDARKGVISVPVYLGDAMQLSITDVMGLKELTVRVPPATDGTGATKLDFPEVFCREPALFDKAVEAMRAATWAGLTRAQLEARLVQEVSQHFKKELDEVPEYRAAIPDMGETWEVFDRLSREGRDTVWAYVARNLSRPLAFSARGGWANVLVGNPPWVAFRHMSADLQKRFRELAMAERVYVGGKLATQNDLCALFVVRATGLYLRAAGRLAQVLPMAALTRGQFETFRTGSFESVRIQWDEAWTMDESVQPLFPVPSCAVFGRRRATSRPLPEVVRAYSGTLPLRDAPEEIADRRLTVVEGAPIPSAASYEGGSVYRASFRQGATLVPRMLCFVTRRAMGRLGGNSAKPSVESRRSAQEKEPWKSLPGVAHPVEAEFLRPVLLGESILPYRVEYPFEGVVPVMPDGTVLDAEGAANRGHDGVSGWMRAAETIWNANRRSEITLMQQLDYYGKLSSQFPIAPLRLVYAASGTQPAACIVRSSTTVFEHKLYWHAPASEAEAQYLVTILNSETARARSAHLQARGQFGARHFDKVVWSLPIPRFDAGVLAHTKLAALGAEAEALAAQVALPEGVKFQRARRLIRDALEKAGLNARIEAAVARLLDVESQDASPSPSRGG